MADLFERHHRPVFSFLRRMTGSNEDAEDLTQEVFVRVLKAIHGYQERSLERAWVFRIARNVGLDHNRARGRAPAVEPVCDRHVARLPDPQDSRLALQQALARLGDAEREAFLMREAGGLGYAEIRLLNRSRTRGCGRVLHLDMVVNLGGSILGKW